MEVLSWGGAAMTITLLDAVAVMPSQAHLHCTCFFALVEQAGNAFRFGL